MQRTNEINEPFESEANRRVGRLRQWKYHLLEEEVVGKRLEWAQRNYPDSDKLQPLSLRRACELFLLEYFGFPEADAPVISEGETEIVWLSQDDCPTLNACEKAGLDTREVCRAVYEKPVPADCGKRNDGVGSRRTPGKK